MKTITYKIALLWMMMLSAVTSHGQEQYFRKVQTKTYTHEAGSTYLLTLEHYDGLGRPRAEQHWRTTPLKNDEVTLTEYDKRGNLSAAWIPATDIYTDFEYIYEADVKKRVIAQSSNDNSPYTKYEYENSPLRRITATYGPGSSWHTHKKGIKNSYLVNVAGTGVQNAVVYTVGDSTFPAMTVTKGSNHPSGQLSVTKTEGEEGTISYTFTDKKGQLVLTRQMDGSTALDTYYVYDDFGRLRAVLPPLAISGNVTTTAINQYAYLYRYDVKGRLAAKKLPGCEWIYYVYDKADRLIFSQDGEQRKKGEWTFTLPDALGRPVLTGICKNSITADGGDPYPNTVISASWSKATNTYKGYTVSGITLTTPVVLTVNFYDNYEFMGINGIPAITDSHFKPEEVAGFGKQYTGGYKGLQTGSWTTRLEGASATGSLYQVMYYDEYGRVVQTKANNHLAGGIDKEYIAYNFTGQPVSRKRVHSATGKTTQTEVYNYTYDHAGRLTKATHKLNSGAVQTLVENTYDEQGRVKTTTPGAQAALRSTYTYNIRSWITENRSTHYVDQLAYNYDGNISKNKWSILSKTRTYNYTYDPLSRLKSATYEGDGAFGTSYTYDRHGNLLTLKRDGQLTASTWGVIDNLTFSYTGNQLRNVNDAGPNVTYNATADFKDYTKGTGTEYTFNANGAMTKDLNKGISSIAYNCLSLPGTLDLKNPVAEARTTYTYSAQGVLLSKLQQWNSAPSASATAGSAVNASSLDKSLRTDYIGNKVYENGTLKRILIDGGYIEGTTYHFYVKDHLGNNVVVGTSGGSIIQRQVYYPFGSPLTDRTVAEQNKQPYKFGDKEFDTLGGLNLYDFHARQHDPATGRFTTMDPLAEKYYSASPYAYCGNNPINYTDPSGMSYDLEVTRNQDGTFTIVGGTLNHDRNIYVMENGERTGLVIGQTLTPHSFFDENGQVVEGAVLDLLDLSGMDFINNEIMGDDPNILYYMPNAVGNAHYDFKVRGLPKDVDKRSPEGKQHMYRGMPLKIKGGKIVYGSARNVGNYGAGYVAAKTGLDWKTAIVGFDALQSFQRLRGGGGVGWETEGPWTRQAQRVGYNDGKSAYPLYGTSNAVKKMMNRP